MALDKLFWRCEGTTLDGTHDFTAGDNTATLNSAGAINTDAALYGTNGLDSPTASDGALFAISSNDIINPAVGAIAISFRITTFAASRSLWAAINTGDGTMLIMLELTGTDDATGRELKLRYRNAFDNLQLDTTAADLQLDTIYSAVVRFSQAASDRRIEVYNSDGSLRTSVEDLATAMVTPTGLDQLWVGDYAAGGGDVHLDNFMVSGSYDEPLEDFLDITSYTEYGGGSPPAAPTLFVTRSNLRMN